MTTLREALRTSPCPSPFGDDDGTVGHCVDTGHCGCDNGPPVKDVQEAA